jgi:hypothetical protein
MYFDRQGKHNTESTLALAIQTARELSITHLVVATSTGHTARMIPQLPDIKVVCVTSTYGFKGPNQHALSEQDRAQLLSRGFGVCAAGHALSGAERAISGRFGGVGPVEIIAHTLRMFGQGTKVCVEIAAMAADAGYIPVGVPVVAVAGSGGGADTALVLRAANSHTLFNTKIDRIICKPVVQDETSRQ